MATVEELRKIIEESRKLGKHPVLEVSPGIWISMDDFKETKNDVVLKREGLTSGVVRKDIFEQIPWKIHSKKSEPKQEAD